MRTLTISAIFILLSACVTVAADPPAVPTTVAKPEAFPTLVNPACSHCRDEAKRRAAELRAEDRILAWTRGYSEGGAIPIRFFLAPYRVISDSYGVFVYDPDASFLRAFAPSYEFRFYGWRNGIMVMRHRDGTLYSCLSGVAFDGPRKGTRLESLPSVVSDWGWWLQKYPGAVAYHMFDKYRPVEPPTSENPNSIQSRGMADPRMKAMEPVLGIWTGKTARAYSSEALAKAGFIKDDVDGEPLVVLWEPATRTASAYRPVASQPRKVKAPEPDSTGVSKPDKGVPIPPGTPIIPARKLTLGLAAKNSAGRFQDAETKSHWDVAGRCVGGELKGYTLTWVDSVQVKWFAWAAEYPATSVYADQIPAAPAKAVDTNKKVKAIAGTAEFLRLLPKPLGTVKAIDPTSRTVTLLLDGEKVAKVWVLEPDAEVKVRGWWGRLEQFKPGDRAWAWLKLDRKKNPVSIAMLADEATAREVHGRQDPKPTSKTALTPAQTAGEMAEQRTWLQNRWRTEGLPGTLTFHHVFSGELELTLDHEGMRWGRSLRAGDTVQLRADPPIHAVVKAVVPWRERTVVRLVVGELESSELRIGQRLGLLMAPPVESAGSADYPLDIGRERSKAERIEWFLASTYCTCGIDKEICTGQFYTLASCNPNGCGMPNHRRAEIGKMIDRGMTDRQILDELVKAVGPSLLRPHLLP
ncbi:MAG TPA: DUF3179 domain-containing (seleno)protein [Gemmataceae bacterium]|nr:DUF3179 domain-containing (seleno)protein [Gemmataceae bacterium]